MKYDGMTRRTFLARASSAACATGALGQTPASAAKAVAKKRLRFSAMVTLGDWAVVHGVWGEPGVYYILNRMRDAGFSRVYWRTTDGCGQTCYPSRVTNAAQQFLRD